MGAIPRTWRGRDRNRGREAARRFFPSGITEQHRSASLVVQASLESSPLPPVPTGCILMANRCPLPGFALQTPRSSTQPLSTLEHTLFRLGGQGRNQYPVNRSHSVLHACCRVLFPQRTRLPFCPNRAPPRGGAALAVETSPLFRSPQGFVGSIWLLFLFPFLQHSLVLPGSAGIFLVLSGVQVPLPVFRRALRIFPLQDVLFMLLWREMNSTFLNPLPS